MSLKQNDLHGDPSKERLGSGVNYHTTPKLLDEISGKENTAPTYPTVARFPEKFFDSRGEYPKYQIPNSSVNAPAYSPTMLNLPDDLLYRLKIPPHENDERYPKHDELSGEGNTPTTAYNDYLDKSYDTPRIYPTHAISDEENSPTVVYPDHPSAVKLPDMSAQQYRGLKSRLGDQCANSVDCASKFCRDMYTWEECGLHGKESKTCFCMPGKKMLGKLKEHLSAPAISPVSYNYFSGEKDTPGKYLTYSIPDSGVKAPTRAHPNYEHHEFSDKFFNNPEKYPTHEVPESRVKGPSGAYPDYPSALRLHDKFLDKPEKYPQHQENVPTAAYFDYPTAAMLPNMVVEKRGDTNLRTGQKCINSHFCASKVCLEMYTRKECGLSTKNNANCYCMPRRMLKT